MVRKREFDFISENVIVLYDDIFPLYIVTGEKNFLIDSGVTAKAGLFYERINSVLSELGGSGKIDTLLLTHSHWDHAGAASWLQKKYGFDIYGSHRTVELLGKQKVVDFINRLNQDFKMMLGENSSREKSSREKSSREKSSREKSPGEKSTGEKSSG
ncbi:MAG: MBL fold metallo-hydrolase, partial [bacterium]|nr:MBL fold metallo-hydrolase [bacterium]